VSTCCINDVVRVRGIPASDAVQLIFSTANTFTNNNNNNNNNNNHND